jgi:hypothetical protein
MQSKHQNNCKCGIDRLRRRIMRFFLLLTILAVGLITDAARAQTYSVIGPGVGSCATWTEDNRRSLDLEGISVSALQDRMWILGFLSGTGSMAEYDPLRGLDAEVVFTWVGNYCRGHPLESIAAAGSAFVQVHPR